MQLQYLPGTDLLLESKLDRSMHFSSDLINTVFVVQCIRLRSYYVDYTLFTKMQNTQHCLHEILPEVKTSSLYLRHNGHIS